MNFGTSYVGAEQEHKNVYIMEKGENNVKILQRRGKKLQLEHVLMFSADAAENYEDFTIACDLMYRRDKFYFMKSMTMDKVALQEKSEYTIRLTREGQEFAVSSGYPKAANMRLLYLLSERKRQQVLLLPLLNQNEIRNRREESHEVRNE